MSKSADSPLAPDSFETRRDVRAAMAVCGMYARVYQGLAIRTPCPIPARGPALIAANHTAGLDPLMIQATCPRPIVWVMTREYYDLPALRPVFKWSQMIPIDRSGRDSAAWREALRSLKRGRVVGVFPEGRIEREDALLPFQTGVTLLAVRGGADLYPVYLDGLQRNTTMLEAYLSPQHPSIAWGRPMPVQKGNPDRNQLRRLTDELQGRVEDLRQQFPAPRRKGRSPLR